MAEVAKKEPSMEDILSSIRKIIAEEGGPESAQTQAPDPQPSVAEPTMDHAHQSQEQSINISEDIRPTIEAQPDASGLLESEQAVEPAFVPEPQVEVPPVAASPAMPEPTNAPSVVAEMPVAQEPQEPAPDTSLASIAASIQNVAQTPPAEELVAEPVVEEALDTSAEMHDEAAFEAETVSAEPQISQDETIHVEMAEATPAPTAADVDEVLAVESEMALEEEAFRGALMSPSADNAVTGSFDRLKRSAMDDLDAKTEAILRPMLREWLDEHLPTLVEKLVREEIERVARG